ncbi:receptor like protein 22-like [Lycium barbarum]|uniref:receptor like protein 22-like n=1 Tax=Lycium barbarum TaxID=112863 RepID=UPI00293F749E|nr:receptor like protein 22-like [Lycium barbarum]
MISSNWYGLENLETLDCSENSLSGVIPPSFFFLPSLTDLCLNDNNFYGQITELQNVTSSLTNRNLGDNNLDGPLPDFFFQLHNLSHLSLSFNNFTGTVQLDKFTKLKKLANLDLSHNRLIRYCLAPSVVCLKFTHLQVPYRFGFLNSLDLHANLLTGEVSLPPPTALYVDLSRNKLYGFISPDFSNYLSSSWFFSVANNKISGTIPSSICNATDLEVLDLSSNNLNGSIPACLAEQSLTVLHLGGNNIRGNMPGNFTEYCRLEMIDLSHNHLEGKIPQSLSNCSNLKALNVGSNKISDTFPCWLRRLSYLHVLMLRFNNFHGSIDCSRVNYTWPALQIIDLASNNFSGVLPRNLFLELEAMKVDSAQSCVDHLYAANRIIFGDDSRAHVDMYYQDTVTSTFKGQEMSVPKIWFNFNSIDFSNNGFVGGIPETVGELKSLYLLNLSHNALTGQIPPAIGNLKELGSLDLSFNKLEGCIPERLSGIPHLSFLNLSYSELVGMIPRGNQLQTFDDNSFMGNKGLCGFPINKACNNDREEAPLQLASEDEQLFSRADIYGGAAVGFAVGMAIIFLPLLVSRGWRECYDKLLHGLIL